MKCSSKSPAFPDLVKH